MAAALERYTAVQLIGFARRLDPGLTGRDFADAGLRLDEMDDRAFAEITLSAPDVTGLRERLAAWPRSAEAADREARFRDPSERQAAARRTPTTGRPHPGMHDSAAGRQQPGPEPPAQPGRDDPEAEP